MLSSQLTNVAEYSILMQIKTVTKSSNGKGFAKRSHPNNLKISRYQLLLASG